MEQAFIDLLKKLVDEQGNDALADPGKCKAYLADYTGSEYRKERRLVVQVIEAGVAKAIVWAADLAACKKAQVRDLIEEHFIGEDIAAAVVDALAFVLRGDTSKTVPRVPPPPLPPGSTVPLPTALPTDAAWVKLLTAGKKKLKRIPEAERSAAVCLAAVQRDGYTLRHVPESVNSHEICLAAVKNNSGALQYVPESLKVPEICITAVKKHSEALKFVPESVNSPEICLAAIEKYGGALKFVPESLKTSDICLAAVEKFGMALEFVPVAKRTPALCLAAVQKDGVALEYVPEGMKTPELCRAAEGPLTHW